MTFRAIALGNDELTANSTAQTITVPASVQAGDVLLIVASSNAGTAVTMTITGGGTTWTQRDSRAPATNLLTYLWSATATASSAGSDVTLTVSAAGRFIGILYAESGALESGLQVAVTPDTTSDTSLAWPDTTVSTAGSFLVGIGAMRTGTVTPATMTTPAGATQRGYVNTAFTTQPSYSLTALSSDTVKGVGTATFGAGTASAAVTNTLYSVALAPASANLSKLRLGAGTVALRYGASAVTAAYLGSTLIYP